jgi:hypothetical protein
MTNVPDIRVLFRDETLQGERKYIEMHCEPHGPAKRART